MATAETMPLNWSNANTTPTTIHDSDQSCDFSFELETKHKDPLYIFIFYGASFVISCAGLGCCAWGYSIALREPFDKGSNGGERDSYESDFYMMQSIVVFLATNILYSGLNLSLAFKGLQSRLYFLNMVYDFFLWALLIAFGVMNMVFMLWDRRLCDGLSGKGKEDLYEKCDIQMFKLLVVELVAVNLGILVAVVHFILLIARCCTISQGKQRERAFALQTRICEEEQVLEGLMERRRNLIEENEALEARRNAPLPPLPVEEERFADDERLGKNKPLPEQEEEDLIDMETNEGDVDGELVELFPEAIQEDVDRLENLSS